MEDHLERPLPGWTMSDILEFELHFRGDDGSHYPLTHGLVNAYSLNQAIHYLLDLSEDELESARLMFILREKEPRSLRIIGGTAGKLGVPGNSVQYGKSVVKGAVGTKINII